MSIAREDRLVIFLDFDGVIVTAHDRFTKGSPWAIHLLNRIIEDTGAVVVVSSSWRCGSSLIDLREQLLGWGLKGDVVDKTPIMHDKERGDEIKAWLDENPCSGFVILDDDSDMNGLSHHLVKTDPHNGLHESDIDKAVEVLRRPL